VAWKRLNVWLLIISSVWVLFVRVLGKNGMVRLATRSIPLVEERFKTVMAGMLGIIDMDTNSSFLAVVPVSGFRTLRATGS